MIFRLMFINSTIKFSKYYKYLCGFAYTRLRYHWPLTVSGTSRTKAESGVLTISPVWHALRTRVFTI
jgi:hypothetical protein